MIDRDGAVVNLRASYELLVQASKCVQQPSGRGYLEAPPLAFVIGALADGVSGVADVIESEGE